LCQQLGQHQPGSCLAEGWPDSAEGLFAVGAFGHFWLAAMVPYAVPGVV
jgi:hypothetical protein